MRFFVCMCSYVWVWRAGDVRPSPGQQAAAVSDHFWEMMKREEGEEKRGVNLRSKVCGHHRPLYENQSTIFCGQINLFAVWKGNGSCRINLGKYEGWASWSQATLIYSTAIVLETKGDFDGGKNSNGNKEKTTWMRGEDTRGSGVAHHHLFAIWSQSPLLWLQWCHSERRWYQLETMTEDVSWTGTSGLSLRSLYRVCRTVTGSEAQKGCATAKEAWHTPCMFPVMAADLSTNKSIDPTLVIAEEGIIITSVVDNGCLAWKKI